MGDKKEYSAIFSEAWDIFKNYADLDSRVWKWNDEDDKRWSELVDKANTFAKKSYFARVMAGLILNEIERLYKEHNKAIHG